MLDGDKLWPVALTSLMVKRSYKGREVSTYASAPKNIYADLCEAVRRNPEKPAFVCDDGGSVTYHEFIERVRWFSQFLYYDKNVRSGDFAALLFYNSLEFCVAYYALAKLGAVTVPLSVKHKPEEWAAQLSQLPVKLLLTHERVAAKAALLNEIMPRLPIAVCTDSRAFDAFSPGSVYEQAPHCSASWEDDLLVMFTSGTTAKSKAVVLSNFNVVNSIMSYEKILGVTEADKTIIATPIYHITGLVALLNVFIHAGATIYLHTLFSADSVLDCCRKENITLLHASPTYFIKLLERRERFANLPSLRLFACGSANMPTEVIKELHRWLPGMEFRTVYGLTESSAAGTAFPDDAAQSAKLGASGMPVPGVKMKLVNDAGGEAEDSAEGELAMFGGVMLERYYNAQTAALGEDGWFLTGDIARFDADGYVYIVDRKKDMINRGGEKVWSAEVEERLYRLDGVLEAAVIGVPDKTYGEVVMAVIRKRTGSGLTEAAVRECIAQRMAKYAIPRFVAFVEKMPTTATGKISKRTLRELYKDIGDSDIE